jgi:hypothetical protein
MENDNQSSDSPGDLIERVANLEKALAEMEKKQVSEDQFIAAIHFLIDLQAENLALWSVLDQHKMLGVHWPPPEIAAMKEKLAPLHAAAASLPRTGLSQIAMLLGTASRHPPG